MQQQSSEFLQLFREVETCLREMLPTTPGSHESATELIRRAAREPTAARVIVDRCKNDLLEFAKLRNLLSHHLPSYGEMVHASEGAVRRLQQIHRNLTTPPTVSSVLNRTVVSCEHTDQVGNVLKTMHENDFDQIVVLRNDSIVNLLTRKTIARWLSAEFVRNGGLVDDQQTVEQILKFADPSHFYLIRPRTMQLMNALDAFKNGFENGRILDAVIITHGGNKNQSPLCIVTPFDIPELLKSTA